MKGVILKKAGYYKLEVWGAQGGMGSSTGGYGGYSYGVIQTSANDVIYVVVGGKGIGAAEAQMTDCPVNVNYTLTGGYNGGGNSTHCHNNEGASGGGATHIATKTGLLKDLSSYKSSVLIVAGGGAGNGYNTATVHGSGGGNSGGNGVIWGGYGNAASGGTQSTGGTSGIVNVKGNFSGSGFGVGQSMISLGNQNSGHVPGCGGGGWYGGGCSDTLGIGGGGSGYIGNSSLLSAKSITKQMYQYSVGCTSSSTATTKTTCTSSTGAHVANAANTGNGYAKITYLGT